MMSVKNFSFRCIFLLVVVLITVLMSMPASLWGEEEFRFDRWPLDLKNASLEEIILTGYDNQPKSEDGDGVHHGIDIRAEIGDPVYAPASGIVAAIGEHVGASGNTITIHHGEKWETTYLHLSEIEVTPGQKVESTTRIGKVGKTGKPSPGGPHLQFGLKELMDPKGEKKEFRDPLKYLPPLKPATEASPEITPQESLLPQQQLGNPDPDPNLNSVPASNPNPSPDFLPKLLPRPASKIASNSNFRPTLSANPFNQPTSSNISKAYSSSPLSKRFRGKNLESKTKILPQSFPTQQSKISQKEAERVNLPEKANLPREVGDSFPKNNWEFPFSNIRTLTIILFQAMLFSFGAYLIFQRRRINPFGFA